MKGKSERLDTARFFALATGRLGWPPEAFWRSTPEAVILAVREQARAKAEQESVLTRLAAWIVAPWDQKGAKRIAERAEALLEHAGHTRPEEVTLSTGGSVKAFKEAAKRMHYQAAEALLAEE